VRSFSGWATCLPRALLVRPVPFVIGKTLIVCVETSKVLHDQLEALAALASRVSWNDKSKSDDSTWESIIVDAFGGGSETDEEVQKAGHMGVKGALAEVCRLAGWKTDVDAGF
jgi:hypothetical protein